VGTQAAGVVAGKAPALTSTTLGVVVLGQGQVLQPQALEVLVMVCIGAVAAITSDGVELIVAWQGQVLQPQLEVAWGSCNLVWITVVAAAAAAD